MHRVVRKFLFAFFVAIFVVSAPLVILYTAGYRLNITSRRVLQTGVLAVSTVPRGVTVTLDGTPLNARTPVVAQRLTAKTYDLKLERRNYHSWEQRITVHEGATTYVDARLFAISEPLALTAQDSDDLIREHKEDRFTPPTDIALLDKEVQVEVWRQNLEGDTLIGILPPGIYSVLHDDGANLLLTNAHGTPYVVARNGGNVTQLSPSLTAFSWLDESQSLLWTDGTEVAIYNAANGQRETITRLGTPIINVAWHPSGDSFFYGTEQTLFAAARNQYDTRPTVALAENLSLTNFWLAENGRLLYLVTGPNAVAQLSLTE